MKTTARTLILLLAMALLGVSIGKYEPLGTFGSITGLILLTLGVAQVFSQSITRPLEALSQWAVELTRKTLSQNPYSQGSESQNPDRDLPPASDSTAFVTLAVQRRDEIGDLARGLQQMERELEQAIAHLKQESAAKERMESELQIGRDIQMNMLTLGSAAFPKHKDLEIYATLQPAHEVGGDFYDFYFRRENLSYLFAENRFCFCVGDVSGKGVPAALFMAVVKTLLKSQSYIDLSPANILTHINEVISVDNPACMFVTLFFGVLNLTEGELVYTNAGHNPPYIRRRDGSIERLDQRHGSAVGIIEGLNYKESRTLLMTGDILVTYTDGVTEAMDAGRNLFSEDRLAKLLQDGQYGSAKDVVTLTTETIRAFQGNSEQADDLTMLALQFLGEPFSQTDPSDLSINREALSSLRQGWKSGDRAKNS